jgi:hypothetical protein
MPSKKVRQKVLEDFGIKTGRKSLISELEERVKSIEEDMKKAKMLGDLEKITAVEARINKELLLFRNIAKAQREKAIRERRMDTAKTWEEIIKDAEEKLKERHIDVKKLER